MQEIVEQYLAAWNEKDGAKRRELVDALWTEDGSYTDPLADAHGRAEIDGLIGAVQQQFPGFVFTPVAHEHVVSGTGECFHEKRPTQMSTADDEDAH